MINPRLNIIISLASGIFIGGALFDIFPEATKQLGISVALLWLSGGFIGWWLTKIILQILKKPVMPILTASALWFHSILEGLVAGLAFGVSQIFGIFILAAMTFHILPEFFAAVALMKGAGSTTKSSLMTTFIGFGLLYASFGITYRLLPEFGAILTISLALSGGAFLFVGLASFWKIKSPLNFIALLAGVIIIFLQSLL